MAFRSNSIQQNSALSKDLRHREGIYFTPQNVRARLFEKLTELEVLPSTILEPSFGSGEFIEDLRERFPAATIHGVEKNERLFNSVTARETEQLTNADFMEYTAEPVDLVIGNPPYFVVTTKEPAAMKGRGNIFVLFIYKCLTKHMVDGSVLAFVLPTSFYNCSYYEPCRKYIKDNTTVLHLESIDANFYETAQDTMLMILRKGATQNPYILERGGGVYLTPFAPEIRRLIEGATTLKALGFSVKTGEVVWNQEKEKLSDSGTPIIYASNIVGNEIRLGPMKGGKKQYIQGFGTPIKGPAILIPRGYGNKYKFAWATVADGFEFHGENHVNVITGPAASMPRVKASLANPKTGEFIRMFVGNGALSKTEIECVLPIF